MRKSVHVFLTLALVLLLAASGVVVGLILHSCVFVGGGIYPAGAEKLDLRRKKLTIEKYEAVCERLPDCDVRWSVPFQERRVDSAAQVLEAEELSEEDLELLAYFPNLRILDGTKCREVSGLARAQELYPELKVLLNVTIDGKTYNQDTKAISTPHLNAEQVKLLECLPNLTNIDARGCDDMAFLMDVSEKHPQWSMLFDITVQGMKIPGDLTETVLEDITSEDLNLVVRALGKLKSLKLLNPKASGLELQVLRLEHPDLKLTWTVNVGGTDYDDTAEEVEVRNRTFSSSDEIRALGEYFPNMTRFVHYDTGLENEEMAALRDEMRDSYKLVWKLYMGARSTAMSDDTWFFPTQQRDYYFRDEATYNMRYLEDCIAVDVGDQPNVKNVEWAAYMPHLQYLILAHTNVRDLSPLKNCKELSFLELDLDHIAVDLTPLLECTGMKDLNLGYAIANAEPLLQMTWLRRLWWSNVSSADIPKLQDALGPVRPEVEEEEQLDENGKKIPPKTDDELAEEQGKTILRFRTQSAVGGGWRRMEGYYAMRDALHAPYDKTNWG